MIRRGEPTPSPLPASRLLLRCVEALCAAAVLSRGLQEKVDVPVGRANPSGSDGSLVRE
jgi:hypothetical protein